MNTDKCKYCPVCGSQKINRVGRMKKDEEFLIYACFECRSGFYLFINYKKVVKGGKDS